MKSLSTLYKIGRGPSSSHTMGPGEIAEYALAKFGAGSFKVILYGSLASTGRGHGTDVVLRRVLGDDTEIVFDTLTETDRPNTMDVIAERYGKELSVRGVSIGGGSVEIDGDAYPAETDVYPHDTFDGIKAYVEERGMSLSDYAFEFEPEVRDHLEKVWKTMRSCVSEGLSAEGCLPGGLHLARKASRLYKAALPGESAETRRTRILSAYTFAAAEQNAANGVVVTAPTCGACGVLAGVLCYLSDREGFSDEKIVRALAAAGIVGDLVRTNASISGAECGCQAEIGTACSMAAAAACELYGMSVQQTECAAEVALEHNLGLTCDPVMGLVQVPCIERNVMASLRALDCCRLAFFLTDLRKISFDTIVRTMYETGRDMNRLYRETAEGGMAKNYKQK